MATASLAKGNAESSSRKAAADDPVAHTVHFDNLSGIKLWDLEHRNLYPVRVRLHARHASRGRRLAPLRLPRSANSPIMASN